MSESARSAKNQAQIKAQITSELQSKKLCAHLPYECTQFALDNYDYCQRHILCDKTAPFKLCSHVYANGKRCCHAAYKASKYCNDHALKAHLTRAKQGIRTCPPKSTETLLSSLTHYIRRPQKLEPFDEAAGATSEDVDGKVTKSQDPFVDIEATDVIASCSYILDAGSESESDVEATTFAKVWKDEDANSSDDDSLDSEHDDDDLLKHADVLSAEEVVLMTKDKLVRLQKLYLDQFNHLFHILREKRRAYLHGLKREKETCCSINDQSRDSLNDQRMIRKLKAYKQYHKHHGKDAILRKRFNEMRVKLTDETTAAIATSTKATRENRCMFTECGIKCANKALPVTRHCRKHILMDPYQVLFRACGQKQGDVECVTPVESIFDDQTCILHRDIPTLRSYATVKSETESEFGDKQVKIEMDSRNLISGQELNPSMDEDTLGVDVESFEEVRMDVNESEASEMEDSVKKEQTLTSDVQEAGCGDVAGNSADLGDEMLIVE